MFKRNIIANFFGRAWPNLLAFFFVPVYIKYMGIEAYGLIGFFTSLQAVITFLDMGLSTTANREMAVRREQPNRIDEARNIVRTLEVFYGLVALFIAFGFLLSADWLSTRWIVADGLPHQTIKLAAIIFGITIALRWPVALYSGVMLGLEKQVLFNVLIAITSTLRSVGAVLAIVFWSPTILMFLSWQLGAALIEFLVMSYATWRVLPKSHAGRHAHFDFNTVRSFWRFSVSVSINSIIATILKQMDRILLSGLVPLQSVGYYSTAYSAYTGLGLLQVPVSEASFPRFSSLISQNKIEELADIYHRASQYLSFISVPIASFVFYFSYDLILIWTQSVDVARNAALPLSLLAIAYGFNSLMQLPWRLQLAYGITRLMLVFNILSLLILFPVMYFLIGRYGIYGAGIGWVLFNISYYFIMPHWMHKTILPDHKWRWFFYDTFLFMVIGWLLFGIAFAANYFWHNIGLTLLALLFTGICYIILCYYLYPAIRFSIHDVLSTMTKTIQLLSKWRTSSKSQHNNYGN